MNKCFLCNVNITNENNTKEHIIPNALGGITKVQNFICDVCNNKTGHKWDSLFVKQLNYFCHFLRIKRERGKIQPQELTTLSGEKFVEHEDGTLVHKHPNLSKIKLDNTNTSINIKARDFNELGKMLKGLKKKYPELDIDTIQKDAKFEYKELDEPFIVNEQIGGKEEGKSIVKTVLSYAFSIGLNPSLCEESLSYLINDDKISFGYYNEKEIVKNRSKGKPLHIIHLEGIPSENLLLGYIEYFSIYKIVVCLSRKYEGEQLSNSYAIDPRCAKEVKHLDIDMSFFKSSDIDDLYDHKKINLQKYKEDFSKIFEPRFLEKKEKNKDNAIERAILKGFSTIGLKENEQMADDQRMIFSKVVASEVVNYLKAHNLL